MNNKKGFIQIPILITIIVSVLILGGVGYIGIQQYKNNQIEISQQETIAENNKEMRINELSEIEKLRQEVEELKNKSNVIINTSTQDQNNSSDSLSRADIVEQWTPKIANVACKFSVTDPENIEKMKSYGIDTRTYISFGSGLLSNPTTERTKTVEIITNLHVLTGHNGFSTASSCEVVLPNGHKYSIDKSDLRLLKDPSNLQKQETIEYYDGEPYLVPVVDAGILIIRNPNQEIIDLANETRVCTASPRIGDDIVILGYPSAGASVSVTATEGIVSGIEDNFFITSAKVEHGNSGGAAIFKDQNCYFGIPTFVISGELESFARILSFKSIFK